MVRQPGRPSDRRPVDAAEHGGAAWPTSVAIIGFILALKGLSSPNRARQGNLLGAAAATLAIAATFTNPVVHAHSTNLLIALLAMAIGAAIAVPAARLVKMTAMPQMVAIFT